MLFEINNQSLLVDEIPSILKLLIRILVHTYLRLTVIISKQVNQVQSSN